MKTKMFIILFCAFFLQSHSLFAEKYWIYDGERQFTKSELYMMLNCGTCSEQKHFDAITNPEDVPVLSDAYALNDKCAELFFPACHYSTDENFCMKTMCQPRNQRQFPFGTDIWQAFSVFVPADFTNAPDWDLIYQFHGHPDDLGTCDNWRSPPFSIAFSDAKKWLIWGRYSTVECNPDGNGSVTTMVLHEGQPVVKDSWSHFVIKLNFNYDGNGRCQVWLKDAKNETPVKIVDYDGSLGFNDKKASYDYASFGYYYGSNAGSDVWLYFDRIIFGDAEENLESMMYGVPVNVETEQDVQNELSMHVQADNHAVVLTYMLPEMSEISVAVYDIRGRKIIQKEYGTMSSGFHTVKVDMPELANGMYFIRLSTEHMTMTKKTILVK